MKLKSKKKQLSDFKKSVILLLGIGAVLVVLFFSVDLFAAKQIWYQDLDKDGFGNGRISIQERFKPNGYVSNKEDTNDSDPCVPLKGKRCQQNKPPKSTDNKKAIIKKLITAENNRDTTSLKKIYRLNNITYFNNRNISLNELLKYYLSIWRKTKKGENQIVSISKVQEDQYEYITQFSWESMSGKTGESVDTISVLFEELRISSVMYRNR